MITVRPATASDIAAMSEVLTASIRELCVLDHHDDPAILARWTANKTPEGVGAMLANPNGEMLVAEHDGAVAAVGSINQSGEIGLNYVDPGHRFAGVSKALLAEMETRLRERGFAEGKLVSTGTARQFYLSSGWLEAGPAADHGGMLCYPMRKELT
jgi:GNAT superfamily N-acetyltransferase